MTTLATEWLLYELAGQAADDDYHRFRRGVAEHAKPSPDCERLRRLHRQFNRGERDPVTVEGESAYQHLMWRNRVLRRLRSAQ